MSTLDAQRLVQSSYFSSLNRKALLVANISSPSKAVLKRFRRVRGGLLKRRRSGKVHKQRKKSSWRRFRLRGNVLVKRKTHIKLLNKMMFKY